MGRLQKLLGARVCELRIKAEMTQGQVAELVEVTNETISRIERGSRSPSFTVLERLAEAFNIEVRELFNFSNREFLDNKGSIELIDLLKYLSDKKTDEIKKIFSIVKIVFDDKNE
jgi:transcriptional regulator with XRE-family HTH domain